MIKKRSKISNRKTDRRTVMTRQIIRDALLECLKTTDYDKITVAALCRQAQISRGTFYLHYDNIDEVLNETLDEALRLTELDPLYNQGCIPISEDALGQTSENLDDHDAFLPACQRAPSNQKFRPLFLDESLTKLILDKLYDREHNSQTKKIMATYHVNLKDAETIFRFTLYGSFAVNRSLKWQRGDEWNHVQDLLHKFFGPGPGSANCN